jgi:hypothetical protein
MLQSFKKISGIMLLALGLQTAWAFSLLGPMPSPTDYTPSSLPTNFGDDWQVSTIGYDYPGTADLGGPKNLGEGYRRNVPTYYYACDANFLNFFGSNGVVAIDQAFNIMNSALTNVDAYSSSLSEFPLNSQAFNFQASALGLLDLKSETLGIMVEQMGLANPLRFAWTLHDRYLPSGAQCPNYIYLVVQRNFDITASPLNQVQYSPYVNSTLYSYYIYEVCPASVPDPQALAVPIQVDPLQNSFTSVAGKNISLPLYQGFYINAGLQEGGFYTGLTRDDAAGLRYLYSSNYIAYESPATGSLLVNSSGAGGTNYGVPYVLYTSNYTEFAQAALVSDANTLSNLYPGLIITSTTPHYSYTPVTTYVAYTTNLIGAPAGSLVLVVSPVVTYQVVTTYTHTYANVVVPPGSSTNKSSVGTVYTITVGPQNGSPAGSPFYTNTQITFVNQPNVPKGDFYINTNVCGPDLIVDTLASIPSYVTNVVYAATNSLGESATQYIVTTSTTHIYVAEPVICGVSSGGTSTNSPGLYRGIGKVQFVKTSYDSLIGQYYQPITNSYTQTLIINSKPINQTFLRIITTPDFLLTAADLAGGPADLDVTPAYGRSINFNIANIAPNLAGPGTIDQPTAITYNKVGNIFQNYAGGNESTESLRLKWASFDGSTNDPVLYPNGTSIENLSSQILVQITPSALPVGTKNVIYPATTFVATGGAFSPPYTWSISSGALPAGMTLSAGGTVSGKPTQSGTFDFTLMLTDSLARTVTWSYALTIN